MTLPSAAALRLVRELEEPMSEEEAAVLIDAFCYRRVEAMREICALSCDKIADLSPKRSDWHRAAIRCAETVRAKAKK